MSSSKELIVGWREWAALPELGVPAIKVKIDTGARTSALHAFDINRISENGQELVEFNVQPVQRNTNLTIRAKASLVDIRQVSDSGGHTENRLVVSSPITIGSVTKHIDITLTERHNMLFRMLVGRTTLADDFFVNPAASFLCGRKSTRLIYAAYSESKS